MAEQVQSFEDWMRELRAIAIEYGFREGSHAMCSFELDAPETEDWRLFYNDGYTARAALDEDLLNG